MARRSSQRKRAGQRPDVTAAPPTRSFWPWLQAAVILAAGLIVYGPALNGGWLWDDDVLITQNGLVKSPDGWWRIWIEPTRLVDYFPLKVFVEWIEWHLFGDNTLGYHLVSLGLHFASALLVWRLLGKFGLRWAWLGGLIFAIHPALVESVAWIAELKNTLSLPFFLLAMIAWLDYDTTHRTRDYILALVLFLAAMLGKTSVVMFPLVLLLHAWWKRNRITRRDLRATAPFFGISLVLGLVTLWFLRHHAIGDQPLEIGGFFSRLQNAGLSLAFYFSKSFWPADLMPIYPPWQIVPPSPLQFWPWPLFFAALYGLWMKRETWGRPTLLGFGFFLIMLLPFIGLVPASYMKFTWVMDHLLYVPILGLIGVMAAGCDSLDRQHRAFMRPYGVVILAVLTISLAIESRGYAGLYRNEETLWTYALARNPKAWLATNNLGNVRAKEGRYDEALDLYRQTLQLKPDFADAYNNIGYTLQATGRYPEAITQFQQALQLAPHYSEARDNLGNALFQIGKPDEAVDQYQQTLKINPQFAKAHNNWGNVLQRSGHFDEAIAHYEKALQLSPDYPDAHYNLGYAFLRTKRLPEAIAQFQQALQLSPDDPATQAGLAQAQALLYSSGSSAPSH